MYHQTEVPVTLNGQPVPHPFDGPAGQAHLQPKIEMLLEVLSREIGETVSRQQLLDEIWGGDPRCDCALTAAVCALRRHLRDDCLHPRYVETVRGHGYRLITPVSAKLSLAAQRLEGSPCATGENFAHGGRATGTFSFLADLVRRQVVRVLALYLVVSWFVLQVGELTFDALGVPAWCLTLLVLLVGLGFPIAAVLAWAFQITPAGVVLDVADGALPANSRAVFSRRLHLLIIACLACALVAMGFRLIEVERRVSQSDPAGDVVASASVNGSDAAFIGDRPMREDDAERPVPPKN